MRALLRKCPGRSKKKRPSGYPKDPWIEEVSECDLLEIARTPLLPVAFLAFGNVAQLSCGENAFHLDFAAATAEKLLC